MKPEIEKLIQEAGLSKLFELSKKPSNEIEVEPFRPTVVKPVVKTVLKPVLKPVAKPVAKPRQLEISAEEKTTKPSNWAEAIKAIFELKRKKNL